MSSRIDRRWISVICLGILASLLAAGCGSSSDSTDSSSGSGGSLTLYSAQHEPMTEAFAKGFEEQSGAKVEVRYGEDEGLASQIEQEGDASPADVVLTENTPPLEALAEKGLLSEVDSSTLDEVPSQYSSSDDDWVGVAARETVMVYNPDLIEQGELPASILDLAKPEWKGKLAIAPSEPDFVPIVSAITKLDGEAAAKEWLEGFAANAKRYNDNEGIIAAVNSRPDRRRHHQPLLLVRGGGRGRQGQDRRPSSTTSATKTRARWSTSPAPERWSRATTPSSPRNSSPTWSARKARPR